MWIRRELGSSATAEAPIIGADAIAVDKRFAAAVFEVGLQGFTYHVCTSAHPFAVETRKEIDGNLLNWVAVLAPLDAILYVAHEAPTVCSFNRRDSIRAFLNPMHRHSLTPPASPSN